MKTILISLTVITLLGFTLVKAGIFTSHNFKPSSKASAKQFAAINSKEKGFVVVELFTSEGCSSCPAADALLGQLASQKKEHVYVLSYHVDYWDRLGWKDAFSKPEWTARQSAYIKNFHLEGAYTPQVVVNGTEQFVGSNNLQLYTSVDNELNKTEPGDLQVQASLNQGKINVTYHSSPLTNATLNVALVQQKAVTDVKRGENHGRHLEHTGIVRELATINRNDNTGELTFGVPAGFNASDYKIVAFVQNKSDLKITMAMGSAIQ